MNKDETGRLGEWQNSNFDFLECHDTKLHNEQWNLFAAIPKVVWWQCDEEKGGEACIIFEYSEGRCFYLIILIGTAIVIFLLLLSFVL